MGDTLAAVECRIVLLTGAAGLVGTWLRRRAPDGTTVVPVAHRRSTGDPLEVTVDLRDPDQTAAAVAAARPDVVVHAAYAKDRESIVTATANVVRAAATTGAGIIHLSTDAVFAGDGTARGENDSPDPVHDYGRWKADAERIASGEGAAIVRLPLLTSLDPPDAAVAKIRHGATTGQPTTWWHDEVRQPAMAADVAGGLWAIARLDPDRRAGCWHLAGPERLARSAIAARIVAALDLDPACMRVGSGPDADDRPRDLWLTTARAEQELGWKPAPVLVG